MNPLDDVKFWEGLRLYLYDDATGKRWNGKSKIEGHLTWGYGHNMAATLPDEAMYWWQEAAHQTKNKKRHLYQGREDYRNHCLTRAAEITLEADWAGAVDDTESLCLSHRPQADLQRTVAIQHAVFQLGATSFGKFNGFWAAMRQGDYWRAAAELMWWAPDLAFSQLPRWAFMNEKRYCHMVKHPDEFPDTEDRTDPRRWTDWHRKTPDRCLWVAKTIGTGEREEPRR